MSWTKEKEKLGKKIILNLYEEGMIKTWYKDKHQGWTLSSGIWSPFYIQLRPLTSHPELLRLVGDALGKLIKEECNEVNRIVGVAMAGIPIVTAISLSENIPSCFTRKLERTKSLEDLYNFAQEYGEHSLVEGVLSDGDNIAIVDDLVTSFNSTLFAIKQLKIELEVRKLKNVVYRYAVVLLDREQGASKIAKQKDIVFRSLIPFKSKGISWLSNRMLSDERAIIEDYLENTHKYQDVKIQKELYKQAIKT
jgi:uridine monophosphate synthetase